MRGEYPTPQPSESSEQTQELVEAKDNVIEFPANKEKPIEHAVEHIMGEAGTHKRSMYHLGELGYSNLEDAKASLSELRHDKEQILDNLNKHVMFSAVGKLKDKVFNQGKEVTKLTEIEGKIAKLERAVRFTQATQHLAEAEAAEEQYQESNKAA